MIDHFVGIIAATVSICGATFVLMGTFRLSSDLIARLAAMPYGGFSLERLKRLSKQKAHTVSGTTLVFLGVVFQVYPLVLIQEPWQILADRYKMAVYIAISLGIILVLLVYRLNVMFCTRTEKQAKRAVLKSRLERALKQNPVGQVYWSSAVEGAESLLGIKRNTNETVSEFLQRLAREFQVPCPSDLIIKEEQ